MYQIEISESTYEQVRQAAQAQRVTVNEFIETAVQLRLRGDRLWLNSEQIAKVRAAQEDVKAGRVLTPEQAKEDFEAHRKEWLAAHPDSR